MGHLSVQASSMSDTHVALVILIGGSQFSPPPPYNIGDTATPSYLLYLYFWRRVYFLILPADMDTYVGDNMDTVL